VLHKETVNKNTLELIQRLQADEILTSFILVGGTALSLQIGHRTSIDIDLFTREQFDTQDLLQHLEQKYGFREQYRHSNTLKGIIDGVFVDMLQHNYRNVADPREILEMRIASKQDIAAMKGNAISGDGTRVKDFIDIYFLLKEFSFADIINFYTTKYESRNDFHAIKSLTYFDEMVTDPWPNMILEKDLNPETLKTEIMRHRDKFLKDKIS
jgi:hypothetical protein